MRKFIIYFFLFYTLFYSLNLYSDDTTKIYNKPTTLTYPSFWHTPFGIHRGTPFWLKVFLGNRTYFNNPQDLACTKLLKDYGKIRKGKDDWQLTVYGVNSGNSEVIYNPSMHSLDIFGKEGHGEGELYHPIGIACNEYGDIYVADTGNHRVVRFFNDGKKVRFIRNIGSYGVDKGKFISPEYVALDSMGRLYVSDTGNNRIQVFSKSGGFLYMIGKEKGILNPKGICVSDVNERYSGYRENYIFVIDGNDNRIQKFDFSGKLIRSIRVDEILQKKVKLTTLEQDYYGNLYVVDNLNSCIYKFSPDLEFITSFGKYGKNDYEFENPTGIAIYKHFGQVFISDKHSAQYFWIGSDVKDFKVSHIKSEDINALEISFFLTERGFVTLEIIGKDNSSILICEKVQFSMGNNTILWNIPELYQDEYLKSGETYSLKMLLTSTYSSYPHIKKISTIDFIF